MKKVIEISEVMNGYIAHYIEVDDLTKLTVANRHFIFKDKEELMLWLEKNV
jgi:hypothetical protein